MAEKKCYLCPNAKAAITSRTYSTEKNVVRVNDVKCNECGDYIIRQDLVEPTDLIMKMTKANCEDLRDKVQGLKPESGEIIAVFKKGNEIRAKLVKNDELEPLS